MAEPTPYVHADEVRRFLPSTSRLDGDFLKTLVLEAQFRVGRKLGQNPLPEDDPEIAGIVRDFALARALERIHGGQSSGTVQGAISIRADANRRLEELDRERAVPGEPGGEGGSDTVADPADSVGNVPGGSLWGPLDAYHGYRYPPPGSQRW